MTETLNTTFTTANLFSLLGVQPILGRDLTRADDELKAPKVMLISERLWKKSFGGDPNIIGRDIRLDGAPRTVVGVMPAGFRFPSQTDIWVPMASVFGMNDNRSWRADQAIARLNPGVSVQSAQNEMSVIANRLAQQYPETNKLIGAAVVPLRDHAAGNVRFSLLVLLASVRWCAFDRVREREPAPRGARDHARTRTFRPRRSGSESLASRPTSTHGKRSARHDRQRRRRAARVWARRFCGHGNSGRAAFLDPNRSQSGRARFHDSGFVSYDLAGGLVACVAKRPDRYFTDNENDRRDRDRHRSARPREILHLWPRSRSRSCFSLTGRESRFAQPREVARSRSRLRSESRQDVGSQSGSARWRRASPDPGRSLFTTVATSLGDAGR